MMTNLIEKNDQSAESRSRETVAYGKTTSDVDKAFNELMNGK